MYHVEGTVPGIVLDIGSHTFKAGTAGEDLPSVLIPSYVARTLDPDSDSTNPRYTSSKAGHDPLQTRRDNVDLHTPFNEDGLIEKWDLFETLLTHTVNNELRAEPREYAVLVAEPNHNGRNARERITELLFEKLDVPAMYLARSAALSAFANGRTTGIVLDVGHSGTSAVPVEDGAIVKGKFIRTAVGGRTLNGMLGADLQKKGVQLRPVWSYKRTITGTDGIDEDNQVRRSTINELTFPATRPSFTTFARMELLEEVKAGLLAAHETHPSEVKTAIHPGVFELPDGNEIEMGPERFVAAERSLFGRLEHVSLEAKVEARLSYVNQYINGGKEGEVELTKYSEGLHGLVLDAIKMCEGGIHRDLYAGVCLTGGTSYLNGLYERLCSGLLESYHKVRVLAASGSNERKYCAWTGGSILAIFSEHQKNWLSRSEYDENGSAFIHRKCQ